jgi:hypothetical protein
MKQITLFSIIIVLLASCGFNGSQKIITEGETTHRVVVTLEYLTQIKELCEVSAGPDPKAVADCTLDNLDVLNLSVDGTLGVACPPGEIPPELQLVCSSIGGL